MAREMREPVLQEDTVARLLAIGEQARQRKHPEQGHGSLPKINRDTIAKGKSGERLMTLPLPQTQRRDQAGCEKKNIVPTAAASLHNRRGRR
jgi:hypothetical protein